MPVFTELLIDPNHIQLGELLFLSLPKCSKINVETIKPWLNWVTLRFCKFPFLALGFCNQTILVTCGYIMTFQVIFQARLCNMKSTFGTHFCLVNFNVVEL